MKVGALSGEFLGPFGEGTTAKDLVATSKGVAATWDMVCAY